MDSERDTVSDDVLLRDENTDEYTGSIASGISSAKESGFSRNNSSFGSIFTEFPNRKNFGLDSRLLRVCKDQLLF